ncbi:MAG: PHP domain-containing protein [Candidatus Eisenbacteria bacterium]|nr:PHP domain-containing protein [Candidatus Eisenbacteria bacterium]MCC7143085.1 PHP domain-containing protein [Candidatus Eisenbacteria bacterium]
MGTVDLHLHTTCSDGRYSPAEVVAMVARSGAFTLAITDHDTVEGLAEAEAEARLRDRTLIPGIELSVSCEGQDLHILGYYLDPGDPGLAALIVRLRQARADRIAAMVARLSDLGCPVTVAAVEAQASGTWAIGRNHVARALVAAGFAVDVDDAFRRYLRDGGPACLPKVTASLEESLEVLLRAGAVPVLAHPATYRLEPVFWRLIRAGLLGIEVFHPSHHPSDVRRFSDMAESWGLCQTGGSDYHGHRESETTPGSLALGSELIEALDRARTMVPDRVRSVYGRP